MKISRIKKLYKILTGDYIGELRKLIGNSTTVLDLACGANSQLKWFKNEFYSIGVDIFEPSIQKSKELAIHNEYIMIDVSEIRNKFNENSFDCVLALDLIEHLDKEQGFKLLKDMEGIASKKTIIFTPNGYLPQGEIAGNPWHKHKSGWTVKDMQKNGYKVIGIGGWKFLRKETGLMKYRPHIFWKIISDISQFFVRNHPKFAFQLLCVKYIKDM
ncbi:MAG: methyltransferase domain-containing protein [Nanoarchaeota archaeon]